MELMAYERIRGPIGNDRMDELFAFLASILSAINGGKNEIHMPTWWGDGKPKAPKKLTVEQASKSLVAMGMAKIEKVKK